MTPATPVAAIRQLADNYRFDANRNRDDWRAIVTILDEYAAFREAQETATTITPTVDTIRLIAQEAAKRIMARTHASSGRAVFVDEIIIQQIVNEVATMQFSMLSDQ